MHIDAHLDVDLVAVEQADHVTLMLELVAPDAPAGAERPASCVQVVLDRSGSMGEDDRLNGAKRALLALIDRLDPTDNFGLVAFDDEATVVVPAGPLCPGPRERAAAPQDLSQSSASKAAATRRCAAQISSGRSGNCARCSSR